MQRPEVDMMSTKTEYAKKCKKAREGGNAKQVTKVVFQTDKAEASKYLIVLRTGL